MSVLTATVMTRLETLYGQAYNKLRTALGDNIDTPNSVKQYVNDAKNAIRGGIDREFGVKTAADLITGVSGTNVAVAPGVCYFGGSAVNITATFVATISANDRGNVALGADQGYSFVVGLQDVGTSNTPTTAVYKSYNAPFALADIANFNTLYVPYPTSSDFIPMYRGVKQTDTTVTALEDMRPIVYTDPPNDDDYIRYAFTGLNTSEDSLLSKSFVSDFRSGLGGIVGAVENTQSLNFKNYWKSQDYQFTDNFRKLYYDTYSINLYTKLVSVSPAAGGISASYSNKVLDGTNALQFKTDTVASTWNATVTVDIYGIKPSYSRITCIVPSRTEGTVVTLDDYTSFVSQPYAAFKNVNNSFDLIGIVPSTNGCFSVGSYINNVSETHNPWSYVYPVELLKTYVPSGAIQNAVYDVGTAGSLFLGLAYAAIPNYGCATCRITVYNK